MWIRNDLRFNIENGYTTADNIHYTSNDILNSVSLQQELGLTEIPDPARGNDKYYENREINEHPYLLVSARPILEVLERIWSDIKAYRDAITSTGGYKVRANDKDYWFHSDVFSRTQQIGLVLLGTSIPAGLQWKTMDGSYIEMTQALAQQIFAAAAASDANIFNVAKVHYTAIQAFNTVEEITNYDWRSIGWPEIYKE
jgi:hypothetical protein